MANVRPSNTKAIIMIVVIVVIAGALYFLNVNQTVDVVDTNENVPYGQQTFSDYQIETIDGKLLYTNDEFKYIIALPSTWTFSEESSVNRAVFYDPESSQSAEGTELMSGMKIEVYAEKDTVKTLKQRVDLEVDNYSSSELIERKDLFLVGQNAIKVKADVLGLSIATYIEKDDLFFTIVGYIGDMTDKEKFEAQYSSILSTFEFMK